MDGCGAGRDSAGTVYSGGGREWADPPPSRGRCDLPPRRRHNGRRTTFLLGVRASQLKDPSLHNLFVPSVWAEHGYLHSSRLELEITESALAADLDNAREIVGSLREAGRGGGARQLRDRVLSLHHLRNFKLDKIKIDRSFIDTLGNSGERPDRERVVGLARGLGLTIVGGMG